MPELHDTICALATAPGRAGIAVVRLSGPDSGRIVRAVFVPEAETGERVFMARCHECHPGGAAGLGPALNNKPLPALLIRLQTRHGLGAMPEFDEATISESELDALVAYLQELRRQRAS